MEATQKVFTLDELSKKSKKYRDSGKKVVLCHGAFDLIHTGHIRYLKSARAEGDVLFVTVTADKFVNKGPGRPTFSINNRLKFLQEIQCIDYLYNSNDATAEKIIKNLKPNFYCKGNDYSKKQTAYDKNLKKELNALKIIKGNFKIIKEASFSSSQFINENSLQNFNEDCKTYINSIRKKLNLSQLTQDLDLIKKKKVLIIGETMIDKYITTQSIGKSGKEPMLVLKPKKKLNFWVGLRILPIFVLLL